MDHMDLRQAFRPMPEKCRDALLQGARMAQDKPPAKRAPVKALLIAAAVLLITATAAIAATRLGWADYLRGYGVDLPQQARDALDATQPKQYQVGPLSFTYQELLSDNRMALSAALIAPADGSKALCTGEPFDTLRSDMAALYGLTPGVTWLEAARILRLPLYRVRALLEVAEEYAGGVSMEEYLWNADGTIVYLNMPGLTPGAAQGELPVTLYMRVSRYDPATGEEAEAWELREKAVLPVSPLLEQKTYLPSGDDAPGGLRVKSAVAQRYATGVYVTCAFSLPQGWEDRGGEAINALTLCGVDGKALPEGFGGKSYQITGREAALTLLLSIESLPESLVLTDGEHQVALK